MDPLLQTFVEETKENLEGCEEIIINLESQIDIETLNHLFRAFHSVKGSAGMFRFNRLTSLTHSAETVIAYIRDHHSEPISHEGVNVLLAALDSLSSIIEAVAITGEEPAGDDGELITKLTIKEICNSQSEPEKLSGGSDILQELKKRATPPENRKPQLPPGSINKTDSSFVKINVKTSESLMEVVGELVLARNELTQNLANIENFKLSAQLNSLTSITTQLQELVMQTRMQPIGDAWIRLPRIIRDASEAVGKDVRLVQSGNETEIDRQVLQVIQDPLVHCIRNSVDHGIEAEEDRLAAGKNKTGTISLSASSVGNFISIEITDDGGGIDISKVGAKVVERGLATAEEVADMLPDRVIEYIFAPGFSTAAKLSQISGRGVGMDVVKTNVEKIGGRVSLQSEPGKGSTVTFKIPLTVAIAQVLLVTNSDSLFAIPQTNVLEVIRISEKNQKNLQVIGETIFYQMRDELLHIVNLSEKLGANFDSSVMSYIIALNSSEGKFGLAVDDVNNAQEVVIKPLSRALSTIEYYSGATIDGSGAVVMILNPEKLVPAKKKQDNNTGFTLFDPVDDVCRKAKTLYMTIRDFDAASCFAIHLDDIVRLVKFKPDELRDFGEHSLLAFEGKNIPVITIQGGKFTGRRLESDRSYFECVVVNNSEGILAMAVGEVYDVIEAPKPDVIGNTELIRSAGEDCKVIRPDIFSLTCLVKASA